MECSFLEGNHKYKKAFQSKANACFAAGPGARRSPCMVTDSFAREGEGGSEVNMFEQDVP